MTYQPLRRVAFCASLVLATSAGSLAQDAPPANGTTPTAPRTTTTNAARTPARATPAVPVREIAPAPAPGPAAYGARLDQPRAAVRAAMPAQVPYAQPNLGVQTVEGVVTQVMAAGADLPGEQMKFSVDPAQDWTSFITMGPLRYSDRSPRPGAAPMGLPGMDMTVTPHSYVATYERTPEGVDLLGMTPPPRSENRAARPANGSPPPAEFQAARTGLGSVRVGTFVSVRYRSIGTVNEVLNLNVIGVPAIEGLTPAARTPVVPGGVLPGAAATVEPLGTMPRRAATATLRVPRVAVPMTPVPPFVGPQ